MLFSHILRRTLSASLLLAACGTGLVLAGPPGEVLTPQLRTKIAWELLQGLDRGLLEEEIGIIVRLKPRADVRRGPGAPRGSLLGVDPVALRRSEAEECSARFLQDLCGNAAHDHLAGDGSARGPGRKGPGAPRSSALEAGSHSDHSKPRALWIANAVAFSATPAKIRSLAERDDVEWICQDLTLQVISPPGAESLEDDPARTAAPASPGEAAPAAREPAPARPEEPGTAWGVSFLECPRVWDELGADGQGVLIGHIDTGVDASHPRLEGKVARFRDFVGSGETAYDDQGHGTHTAGILVAGGGLGTAPGARLVVAKALDKKGGGKLSRLLEAMQWMLDPDGDPATTGDRPSIASNSWGVDRQRLLQAGEADTLFWDAVKAWRDAGILPVFASGNSGVGTEAVPGSYPIALAVGAVDPEGKVARFSAGKRVTWEGMPLIKPDVVSPGVRVPSTFLEGRFRRLSGTSMAAPHVAGVAALLKQLKPDLDLAELEAALLESVEDRGEPGKDIRFGLGIINAFRAARSLGSAPGPDPGAPPPPDDGDGLQPPPSEDGDDSPPAAGDGSSGEWVPSQRGILLKVAAAAVTSFVLAFVLGAFFF